MKVLLVDDEVRMVTALGRGLAAEGFTVELAHDGPAALAAMARSAFDVVVLDIMLPQLSGYEVLKRLRAAGVGTPVVMLSAKDGEYDLADALDLGADDYLVKPFSFVVLVARIRAVARRGRDALPPVLSAGDLELDTSRQVVRQAGAEVRLSPREFRLLEFLMRREGASASKSELLDRVFDADPDSGPNVVEVYVGYLRRKLGRDTVVTVPGGYRLGAP